MERLANCYAQKRSYGILAQGGRQRKRGLWNFLAADAWLRFGKSVQAEKCLDDAKLAYGLATPDNAAASAHWMTVFLQEVQDGIVAAKLDAMALNSPNSLMDVDVQPVEEVSEALGSRTNRKSVLVAESAGVFVASGLDAGPLSPVRSRDSERLAAKDGFE
jgi:hypothetical protein